MGVQFVCLDGSLGVKATIAGVSPVIARLIENAPYSDSDDEGVVVFELQQNIDIVNKVLEWCKHYVIVDFRHLNTLTMNDLFPPPTLSPMALSPARENAATAPLGNTFPSAFGSSTKRLSAIIEEEEANSSFQSGGGNDAASSNNNSGGNSGGDGNGDVERDIDMDVDVDGADYDNDSFTYEDSASLHASVIEPDSDRNMADDDNNNDPPPPGDNGLANTSRINALFDTLSSIELIRFPDWDVTFFGTFANAEEIRCAKEAAKQLGIEVLYRRCLGAEVAEERESWEEVDWEMEEVGGRMGVLGV